MQTVFSETQLLHDPPHELHCAQIVPYFESPMRAERILEAISRHGLGPIVEPNALDPATLRRVHSPDYVQFMEAVSKYVASNKQGDAPLIPHTWRQPEMVSPVPDSVFGQLGHYAFDAGTPITAETWAAAAASASSAVTAAEFLFEQRLPVFALCRPPGHHAAAGYYGGYCYLNNAAIAAQHLLDSGSGPVAIVDVDYHHGNGTQSIFYRRRDVLFASLHADPRQAYPYFSGHPHETGEAEGVGYNINVPLPPGSDWPTYAPLLREVMLRIREFQPKFLIVSLGVDTFESDPIADFRFSTDDFFSLGEELAVLDQPTMFVMEGGYAIQQIGDNVVGTLKAFERTSAL